MPVPRPTPFDLVFGEAADLTFTPIRQALIEGGIDPRDRDGFLMVREAVALLRELRPDEGLGEGIDQLAALVQHAYLFWADGRIAIELPPEHLETLLGSPAPESEEHPDLPAFYVQLPLRRIWAETVADAPPEPMDGCFVHGSQKVGVTVLGVFGLQPERSGFTVVEVAGPRPVALARPDGSRLFSPTLPGGALAGLFSITGAEELLELGWRTRPLLVAPEAGRWKA
jgi:hypothetical protein